MTSLPFSGQTNWGADTRKQPVRKDLGERFLFVGESNAKAVSLYGAGRPTSAARGGE